MTRLNRMLAIRANAAGPYKVEGPCHDCGENEGLVAMPLPFAVSIAICRRCRFNRTGVPDRRNMLQGEASIAYEKKVAKSLTAPAPVKIRALLPAVCETTIETDDEWIRRMAKLRAPLPPSNEPPIPEAEADAIFSEWDEGDDRDIDQAIVAQEETDEDRERRLLDEIADLTDELDGIFGEIDRRLGTDRAIDSKS